MAPTSPHVLSVPLSPDTERVLVPFDELEENDEDESEVTATVRTPPVVDANCDCFIKIR